MASRIRRQVRLLGAVSIALFVGGCATRPALLGPLHQPAQMACRSPIGPGGLPSTTTLTWLAPADPGQRRTLTDWCRSAGPPVVAIRDAGPPNAASGELLLVSWNVHAGGGDVSELIRRVRRGDFTNRRPPRRFVLLLQEAFRAGTGVDGNPPSRIRTARAIRPGHPNRRREDVVSVAHAEGLSLFYAPSMANGDPAEVGEDRGNAILSTEALSDLAAIELPFERQRRVAVAATVVVSGADGVPRAIRVASVHLESLASSRRLWLFATGARVRQARSLVQALGAGEVFLVGGDLNTWRGFSDPAYKALAEAFPDSHVTDRRPTFPPFLRLDHVLFRVPDDWSIDTLRLDDRLGSDHYPLAARIRVG